MQNITNKLNCKAELYGMVNIKNELGEIDRIEGKIKDIYCNILPKNISNNKGSNTPVTEIVEHSHRFLVRAMSIKEPRIDMFFKYKGLKYSVIAYNFDFKNNEFLEMFTELILE